MLTYIKDEYLYIIQSHTGKVYKIEISVNLEPQFVLVEKLDFQGIYERIKETDAKLVRDV